LYGYQPRPLLYRETDDSASERTREGGDHEGTAEQGAVVKRRVEGKMEGMETGAASAERPVAKAVVGVVGAAVVFGMGMGP
jgi:hypothetical protein